MGDFYMVEIKVLDQNLSQMLINKNYALPNTDGGSPRVASSSASTNGTTNGTTSSTHLSKSSSNGGISKGISTSSGVSKNLIRIINGSIKPSETKNSYPNGELKMEVGKTYEVIVTNVETLNDFYIQHAGKFKYTLMCLS